MIDMSKRAWLVIGGLILVAVIAIGFRFYDIKHYPPGLFPDEAANGEDALLVLKGDVRPFYPRGNGREGLYFYLLAASIAWFGIGVWQLHIVSAVIGVLTSLSLYFATRVWFGRLSGLLAALFCAVSYWQVTLSRTSFRAILIPFVVASFLAAVGLLIQNVKREDEENGRKLWPRIFSFVWAAVAGAVLAGGFYTYIAYRVMIGVVLGVAVLVFLDDLLIVARKGVGSGSYVSHIRRYWWHLVVAIVAFAIVIAPLAIFFIENPASFVGRAGQVSIFNKELQQLYGGGTWWGTLLYSTRETILSFFAGTGDLNWRHNVAGYPLLNPLVGVLFLLGLVWVINGTVMVLYKIGRRERVHLGMIYPTLLLLISGMLAPVVTTAEGMPHGLRSIGLAVPIFMLAGTAGSVLIYWVRRRASSVLQSVGYGLVMGLLVLGVVYNGSLYFFVSRTSLEAHYAYRADLTEVSAYINELAASSKEQTNDQIDRRPYLVLDKFSLQTVHFLTSVMAHEHVIGNQVHPDAAIHKWRQVDPEISHLQELMPGDIIIFTQSTLPDADRYVQYHTGLKLVEQRYNRFGQEIMRVFQASSDDGIPNQAPEGGLDA